MMITAHSGCDGTDSNSMDYIRYASSLPIDALEIDIRRGTHGDLVLTHDPVSGKPLVSLEKAFQYLAPLSIKINCDLKEYGLEEDLFSVSDHCGLNRDRIILTGSVTDCFSYKRKHPSSIVFINAEELVPSVYVTRNAADLDTLISQCQESGYTVININYRACNDLFLKKCLEANIGLSLWTLDDIQELKKLMDMDSCIINITTNAAASAAALCGFSLRHHL